MAGGVRDPLWENEEVGGHVNRTFVGREAELDRLVSALAQLETTGARTVLVSGDAGIGKSRLVEELLDRARASGVVTAVGLCTPTDGGGLAYGPFVGALRDLADQLDDAAAADLLGPARRALGLDAGDPGAETPSNVTQVQRFETVLAFLQRLAERGRVVLVFEDLHWADSASIDLIDFLTRNLRSEPVLVVATYRGDELHDARNVAMTIAELTRHRAVTSIDLGGLDRDATALLMREVLGARPEWALLEAVHTRSGGNPFFAQELTAVRGASTVPASLRNIILLRIADLDADTRDVVATLAVAGRPIDHRLLSDVIDLDDDRLDLATSVAVERHLLAVDEHGRLDYRHDLQREAVYESLLPAKRARLHRRLALAIRAHGEVRSDWPHGSDGELAHHWWEAGDWGEATRAALRAGNTLATLLAAPEAYAHYERAVAAYERAAPLDRTDVDRVDLLLRAAEMAFLVGETARSIELLETMLSQVDASVAPERRAVALRMYGRHLSVSDPAAAWTAFEEALALLESDRPTPELAGVVAQQASYFLSHGRLDESIAYGERAVDLARETDARDCEAHALVTLGVTHAERGEYVLGTELAREGLLIAEEVGNPDLLFRSYLNLTHILMNFDGLDEAASMVRVGDTEEWVTGVRLNGAGQNGAEAMVRLGRFDEAMELLERMERRGTSGCVYGPYGLRTLASLRRGELDLAEAHLAAAEALAVDIDPALGHGVTHALRAELLVSRGDPDAALDEVEHALADLALTDDRLARPESCVLGIRVLADLRESARRRGRTIDNDKLRRQAAELVDRAQRDAAELAGPTGTAPARVRALAAQCRAEATRLETPDAVVWKTAVNAWKLAGEPWPTAYCLLREAAAQLATHGSRSDAAGAITDAWRIADTIGAQLLRTEAERLAQRARVAIPASDEGDEASIRQIGEDLGLTAREVEVLDQLACGRTDRQIADALFISKKTVSVHVSNILRKLDAGNRIDAGEIGQRAGLGRERG
jgi:pentatricopeptide repeat protein